MSLLPGLLLLAGCAPQPWKAPDSQVAAAGADRWEAEAGAFRVSLKLGDPMSYDQWTAVKKPGDRDLPPAPSSYLVTYHGPAVDKSLRLESQLKRDVVSHNEGVLRTALHLTASAEGDAVVIDEDLPNDCAPQVNYSYVRVDPQGNLQSFYFTLPVRPTQVEGEYPHIESLRQGVVHYRYAGGARGSVRVADLKKVEYPQPPG